MRRYSEAVKADVRKRMSPPQRQSVARISEELSAWFNERVDQLTQDKRWLDAKALVREFFLQGPSCP